MGERYEFWTHQQSGETWAVRVNERGLVVNCCGPLEWAELHRSELPRLVYDPAPADWLNWHVAEFIIRDDVE